MVPILSYLTSPSTFDAPEVLATRQLGDSIYFWNNTYYLSAGAIDPASGSIGQTEQWYSFKGPQGTFGRHVKADDGYEPVLIIDEIHAMEIDVPETVVPLIG